MAPRLIPAAEVHEQNMHDLDYRREHERTRVAADVAVQLVRYRAEHGLTQAQLARKLGLRQPNVARLESADHTPSVPTLMLLSEVLGLDVTIRSGRLELRAG